MVGTQGGRACPKPLEPEEVTGECPQKTRKMTNSCPRGDRGRKLQSVSTRVLRHLRATCVLEMTLNQSYIGKREQAGRLTGKDREGHKGGDFQTGEQQLSWVDACWVSMRTSILFSEPMFKKVRCGTHAYKTHTRKGRDTGSSLP